MKLNRIASIILVLVLVLVLTVPALAASPGGQAQPRSESALTPEEASQLLLGFVGVALSVAFKYVPKWKAWFDSFQHQGLLMLSLVIIAGGIYFALACTPYAVLLGIQLTCELASVFLLIKAIAIIAIGNQLAYMYLPERETNLQKLYDVG